MPDDRALRLTMNGEERILGPLASLPTLLLALPALALVVAACAVVVLAAATAIPAYAVAWVLSRRAQS